MDWKGSTSVLGPVSRRNNQNKNASKSRRAGLHLDESSLRPLLPASRSSQPTPPTSPPAVPPTTASHIASLTSSRIPGCAISRGTTSEPCMSRIIAAGEVVKGEHELSEVLAELRDGMIAENSEDVKTSNLTLESASPSIVHSPTTALRRASSPDRIDHRLQISTPTSISPPSSRHPSRSPISRNDESARDVDHDMVDKTAREKRRRRQSSVPADVIVPIESTIRENQNEGDEASKRLRPSLRRPSLHSYTSFSESFAVPPPSPPESPPHPAWWRNL